MAEDDLNISPDDVNDVPEDSSVSNDLDILADKFADDIAELEDNYLRAKAEMQNLQKRSIEEVKKARDYSISSFVKDIIVIKDYLEMALKDESDSPDSIKTGVNLTLKQLIQVFDRNHIKQVLVKEGDKLDPHFHQAMGAEESEQATNTILKVMQPGYLLSDRVLRPAMVIVAK